MASLSSLWLTFHLKYICAKQFLIAWSDTHKWVRNNTTMKHMEWAFMTCKTVQIIKKHILRKKINNWDESELINLCARCYWNAAFLCCYLLIGMILQNWEPIYCKPFNKWIQFSEFPHLWNEQRWIWCRNQDVRRETRFLVQLN